MGIVLIIMRFTFNLLHDLFSKPVLDGVLVGALLVLVGVIIIIVKSGIRFKHSSYTYGIASFFITIGFLVIIIYEPNYSLAFSTLATLALAFVAFMSIKIQADKEIQRKKEAILNQLLNWAIKVRKFCTQKLYVMTANPKQIVAGQYNDLKYEGKGLAVALTKEKYSDNLIELMNKAIGYFSDPDPNLLYDSKKLKDDLDKDCESIIDEIYTLLSK